MKRIDAAKERMECAEILGIPGLFTPHRINRDTIPQGMYAYELQRTQDGKSYPSLLACRITTSYFGTVLTASPVPLAENGCCHLETGDFLQSAGEERLTVSEFEYKQLSPKAAKQAHRACASVR